MMRYKKIVMPCLKKAQSQQMMMTNVHSNAKNTKQNNDFGLSGTV